MSLQKLGALYKDYDNGYSLVMLSQKYSYSEAFVLSLICKRIGL